jgi:hypothetical protein
MTHDSSIYRTKHATIEMARRAVEAWYNVHNVPSNREWLVTPGPKMYPNGPSPNNYNIELHVLNGTPPKGFVLFSISSGATAIAGNGEFLHKFYRGLMDSEREAEYRVLASKFGLGVKFWREMERSNSVTLDQLEEIATDQQEQEV